MKTEQEISEAEYLKQDSTLLTNFTKDVFEIYQKAVGHYNWIKGVPVVEIREKAYNIARFRMDDHMSLHKTGHHDGEGLDNFWRLHELYRNELYLKSQLQKAEEDLLQETGKCMKYQHQIEQLQEERDKYKEDAEHNAGRALEIAQERDRLQEEMKEDEHAMKILVAQVQQLQEENERLKLSLSSEVQAKQAIMIGNDSEVKTLREALKEDSKYFKGQIDQFDELPGPPHADGYRKLAILKSHFERIELALQSKGGEQ